MTTKEKPIYNGKQTFFISLTIKLGNKEKIKESIQEIKEFIKKFNITEEMRNYDGYSYLLYNQSITE